MKLRKKKIELRVRVSNKRGQNHKKGKMNQLL